MGLTKADKQNENIISSSNSLVEVIKEIFHTALDSLTLYRKGSN